MTTRAVALIGGTGRSGPALAGRLSRAGVEVVIGSRDAGRAEAAAAEVAERVAAAGGGARVHGAANEEAVATAGLAIVTVPYEAQEKLLPGLADALRDRVVVSTAIPMRFDPERGPELIEVPEGSAAEQVRSLLPGARVVAGLHSVSNVHLGRLDRALDEDVLLTGDDGAAKEEVAELLGRIDGLRTVDAGPLSNARHSEALTVLLLSINRRVKRSVGIRLTNLPA